MNLFSTTNCRNSSDSFHAQHTKINYENDFDLLKFCLLSVLLLWFACKWTLVQYANRKKRDEKSECGKFICKITLWRHPQLIEWTCFDGIYPMSACSAVLDLIYFVYNSSITITIIINDAILYPNTLPTTHTHTQVHTRTHRAILTFSFVQMAKIFFSLFFFLDKHTEVAAVNYYLAMLFYAFYSFLSIPLPSIIFVVYLFSPSSAYLYLFLCVAQSKFLVFLFRFLLHVMVAMLRSLFLWDCDVKHWIPWRVCERAYAYTLLCMVVCDYDWFTHETVDRSSRLDEFTSFVVVFSILNS